MKAKHNQGYFLPLAVLFAGILTATWANQFRPNDDVSDWHEASRVFDDILFWQQAAIYFRIDSGNWPLSLTEVESRYNIPWAPSYLSGFQRSGAFVIQYQSTNESVIQKMPEDHSIGMHKVGYDTFELVVSDSKLLVPSPDVLLREGPEQRVETAIDADQHHFTTVGQLEGALLATLDGFSLAGSFTTTNATELHSNRITADDIVISGRGVSADFQQLATLNTAIRNCIEVTRYCL